MVIHSKFLPYTGLYKPHRHAHCLIFASVDGLARPENGGIA